jgi:hypothetical protein
MELAQLFRLMQLSEDLYFMLVQQESLSIGNRQVRSFVAFIRRNGGNSSEESNRYLRQP